MPRRASRTGEAVEWDSTGPGKPLRRVLIVTYYFPPAGGSGVQRVLKFVRYLPIFGWQPYVLTARNADYPTLDPSLAEEVPPGTPVLRTRIVEPYRLYRRLTGKTNVQHLDVAVLSRGAEEQARLSERVSEWVRRTFFIPDARVGWLPFAVSAGVRAARVAQVRVILSSAPPYTCHLIGYWLHRLTRKPWVADFRDSWVDWVSAPKRKGLSRRIDVALEGLVLRAATRVVTVSEGVKEDLLSRHPELGDDRWVLITNGFDPEDFEGIEPAPRDQRLTLIYSGSLYGPRHPGALLEGLCKLRDENPQIVDELRLRFVGRIAEDIRRDIREVAGDAAEFSDYLPHRLAIAELLASDVAILIVDAMPASKGVLTGKLFEYLGARKPVLALAPPDGDAARLVASGKCGWVVPPGDGTRAAAALREIHTRWREGTLPEPSPEFVRNFDRRYLTGRLAELLGELTP